MQFEKCMNEHLHGIRNDLYQLGLKHPQLTEFFGLSHAGLIDSETEKLVEAFTFKLTHSEAMRNSQITNTVKPFIHFEYPEWFRPVVSSCICEFNNYAEYQNIDNLLNTSDILNFSVSTEEKNYKLSSLANLKLTPFSIEKSFFSQSETLSYLNIYFKNELYNEDFLKESNKIRVFFNMDNPEKTMELFYYLFHSNTYGNKPKFIVNKTIEELNSKIFSHSFSELNKNSDQIYFQKCNKLNKFNYALNYLNHFFFLEIDLSQIKNLHSIENFKLEIPLTKDVYQYFNQFKNFLRTNCLPLFDIYSEENDTIPLFFSEDTKYAQIGSLKDNGLIEVVNFKLYDHEEEKYLPLPKHIELHQEIQFSPGIPFNIIQYLITDDNADNFKLNFESDGIYTNYLKDEHDIIHCNVASINNYDAEFGTIVTRHSPTILYSEAISNTELFNFLHNWNYYLSKKMNNLSMLIEYFNKVKPYFFNYKNQFINYFSRVHIHEWKICARMNDSGQTEIVARYYLYRTSVLSDHFFDRMLEVLLASIAENDLIYEIKRL